MKKFALGAIAVALLVSPALAQKVATTVVAAKSFQLMPANAVFVPGFGYVYTYFTTFNGTSGMFLIDGTTGAVSGEVRPRSGYSNFYEGAYGQTDYYGQSVFDYGSFTLTVPSTDIDADGVPDFLQFNRSTNITATGSGYSMGAGASFSMTTSIVRAANSAFGSYTATTQIPGQPANTVNGQFILNGFSGSVSYVRGATNTLLFNLTSFPSGITVTGSTTYTISNNGNTVSYSSFSATASDGDRFTVNAGSLTRTGYTYRGSLSLVDGLLETYWTDFRDYWVSITDSNDSDADGLPDLSDTLTVAPTISSHPTSQTVTTGSSVTFTVTASGTPAPTYQWRKDGQNISGANSSSLTRSNVQIADAGTYTVVATNSAGAVTSNGAVLTVQSTPAFSLAPAAQRGSEGGTVQFTATADGTPAPALQWQRLPAGSSTWANLSNSGTYSGVTSTTLTLSALALAMNGDQFRCVATNAAGSTPSAAANLTVDARPPVFLAALTDDIVSPGSTVTLSVSVTGTAPFNYQWKLNDNPIPGATAPTLTVANIQGASAGNYSVTVTNSGGTATSSASVRLTQTIAFNPPGSLRFSATALTLVATASSGLPVTFTLVSGTASLNGSQLTPAGTGSLTVRATQPGNSAFAPATPLERTLTILPSLESWRRTQFTASELSNPMVSGSDADPDGDGLPNALEYIMGLNPRDSRDARLPILTATADAWIVRYEVLADRKDVPCVIEYSSDLVEWWQPVEMPVIIVSTVNGVETREFQLPRQGSSQFFRLRASAP